VTNLSFVNTSYVTHSFNISSLTQKIPANRRTLLHSTHVCILVSRALLVLLLHAVQRHNATRLWLPWDRKRTSATMNRVSQSVLQACNNIILIQVSTRSWIYTPCLSGRIFSGVDSRVGHVEVVQSDCTCLFSMFGTIP
jgi:hypothetical protein